MSEKTLQEKLDEVSTELRNEQQRGALTDAAKVAELQAKYQELLNQSLAAEQAVVEQKQTESSGGLKETIFQIWDSVLPAETGKTLFGINEHAELSQLFRQMVDLAVDENNAAFHAYIGEQLEAKDAKIRELTANVIDLETQLQEASRKAQAAEERADSTLAEFETLENSLHAAEADIETKVTRIVELSEQLKAKDEQIAKLEEEVAKPAAQPTILLPNSVKPSQTLEQMMQTARNNGIKSAAQLALEGNTYRGKVSIQPVITPPTLGGSNDTVSFQGESSEDRQADTTVSGVLAPEAAPVAEDTFQEAQIDGDGLAQENVSVEMARESSTLEERVAALEAAVFGKKVAA